MKSETVFACIKEIFIEKYYALTEMPMYFTGKDGFHLKQLIRKIQFSFEQKKKVTPTDEQTVETFKFILDNLPKWHVEKLSLSNINSKYNEIIAEIRSRKSASSDSNYLLNLQERLNKNNSTVNK